VDFGPLTTARRSGEVSGRCQRASRAAKRGTGGWTAHPEDVRQASRGRGHRERRIGWRRAPVVCGEDDDDGGDSESGGSIA
jgi:hypothetical protein